MPLIKNVLLDFTLPLKQVNGKAEGEQTQASILAEFIGTESSGKTTKLFGWYNNLLASGKLELDQSDCDDLYKIIDETNRLMVFVKGQLLETIKKASTE